MASRGDIENNQMQPVLSDRWSVLPFDEVLDETGEFTKLKTKDLAATGKYPVVDQGINLIAGYADDEKLLYKGDLPVIIFGDHTRSVKFIDFQFAVGADGTKILRPHRFLSPKFFYYYLKAIQVPSLGYSRHYSILKNIMVPIPPFAEQKRMVAKLDKAFAHLDTLKAKLERIPELLKSFRQAVLTQAVTGKLTEDWRANNKQAANIFDSYPKGEMRELSISIPKGWICLPFDAVAQVDSNLVEPLDYLELPLIAPDNIESLTGRLLSKPLVSDIMPKSAKHKFIEGCIVYSKIRPYLSKLIIADFDGLCSADMYPISTKLNIKYLYYYMLSEVFLGYANTSGERSVLPKINQKELGIIPITIPPAEEQQEIVDRINKLFRILDSIETQLSSLKERIEQLPQALLLKAFQGSLVSQEESDEPIPIPIRDERKTKENRVTESVAYERAIFNEHIHVNKNKSVTKGVLMDVLEMIKKHFGERAFSFDELNALLNHSSKQDYIATKRVLFNLLRNHKFRKKGNKIIAEVDKPSGSLRYKFIEE